MILALSVENTNLVLGVFEGEELLFTSRMATDRSKTGDEYAIAFRSILDLHNLSPREIQGSIVSSVVPALINQIKVALMGPLAGIGDSLIHGTLRPIMAGLGCSMIMASHYTSAAGAVVFVLVMTLVQLLVRYFGIFKGYLGGLNLVARLQMGGILDREVEA